MRLNYPYPLFTLHDSPYRSRNYGLDSVRAITKLSNSYETNVSQHWMRIKIIWGVF